MYDLKKIYAVFIALVAIILVTMVAVSSGPRQAAPARRAASRQQQTQRPVRKGPDIVKQSVTIPRPDVVAQTVRILPRTR